MIRKIIAILLGLVNAALLGELPTIPVASVLIIKNKKVLGIDRADGEGISLPGGIIKWNEDSFSAAIRETKEETGLIIKPTQIVGIYSSQKSFTKISVLQVVYGGKIISGHLKKSIEGRPGWFSYKKIIQKGVDIKQPLHDYQTKK